MADHDTGPGEAKPIKSQSADQPIRPPVGRSVWKRTVVWSLIVVAVAAFAAWRMNLIPHRFATLFSSDFEPGKFPNCDSQFATQLLRQAVDSSPRYKKRGIEVQDITELKDLRSLTNEKKKWCSALLLTNGGKVGVWFWMEWKDPAKTEISLSSTSL